MTDVARIARLFGALANPHRLAIFERLREVAARCCKGEPGEMCVCDVADGMAVSLSTVSHHLKELKQAGLIRCEKRGQWVYCAVNADALGEIERFCGRRRAPARRRRPAA